MAIEVRIPTILRTYTGGEKSVDASGATLVEHFAYGDRYEQARGVSPLAAALNIFNDIRDAHEATMMKIKLAAMFGVKLTRKEDTLPEPQLDDDGNPVNEIGLAITADRRSQTPSKTGLPKSKGSFRTVDRTGNTSSGSVPLALDEAIRSGKVKRGELLLLEAFGGGFTWGSALVRY